MSLIPKFIDEGASIPSKAIGTTLADIWNLTIGSHISLWTKKQEVRQQHNLQDYMDKIEGNTQSIPEVNLTDPQLHIVGPALEASKYYIDSEELRSMFANLVAASIDDRKIDTTHPSFVEIIKQMSPLDAQNLKSFGNVSNHPIVNYVHRSDYGQVPIHEHVFLKKPNCDDVKQISISITNLVRLGLVSVTYNSSFSNDSYKKFTKHEVYKGWEKTFAKTNAVKIPKEIRQLHPEISSKSDIIIEKGIISLTPFGTSFKQVCI